MNVTSSRYSLIASIFLTLLLPTEANANNLVADPNSHWLFHFGASVMLYGHIGGGVLGILSGLVASLAVKGGHFHRLAGRVFVVSMAVCYLIAAFVAPFLDSQQSTNFVASVLALYLLITGVTAARRKHFVAGYGEKIGLGVAAIITTMGGLFMYLAQQSPNGSFDGSPPQAYVLFIVAGGLALIGEINVLVRKTLTAKARISRHLWRLCMSFFIASGSLFFGQTQVFPTWFETSILPVAFGFFPLAVLIIYIIKIRLPLVMHRRSSQAA
ncbi:hypothetical protein [Alteromonas sp. ASW11-130]|uniref:hypothetical protein n=1 Tax=Alteromonas sp. ASW11-130 TaxID=3015775 RepID=UPI002242A77D|nr:hypothetical protein [Alteromonas sp. ASW11-130]MCW8090515.1 hypothetical protein [Alteromonas sp. ASW11-130]